MFFNMFCFPEIFRWCFRNVGSQKCCVILDNRFWGINNRIAKSSQPCAVVSDRTEKGSMQLKLHQEFREQLQVRTHLYQRWFRHMCCCIPALHFSLLEVIPDQISSWYTGSYGLNESSLKLSMKWWKYKCFGVYTVSFCSCGLGSSCKL